MRRKLTIDKLKLVPKYLDEGLSYKDIAQRLDVSVSSLDRWIKKMKGAHVRMKITRGPKPLNLEELKDDIQQ